MSKVNDDGTFFCECSASAERGEGIRRGDTFAALRATGCAMRTTAYAPVKIMTMLRSPQNVNFSFNINSILVVEEKKAAPLCTRHLVQWSWLPPFLHGSPDGETHLRQSQAGLVAFSVGPLAGPAPYPRDRGCDLAAGGGGGGRGRRAMTTS